MEAGLQRRVEALLHEADITPGGGRPQDIDILDPRFHARVLAESNRLLKNLRVLTHSCLAAQEEGRRLVSRQLQDEIGQGLLGIHVQLLTLKKALRASTISLRKEIGSAQRVASKSTRKIIRTIHRPPREG